MLWFLSVVSYNLLSSTLAQKDPKFQGTVYASGLLDWTSRRTRLLNEIASYDSDVVCVQELDESDYEGDFTAGMVALGYNGKVFKKRNVSVEHGFSMFYKESKATLVSDCTIPFPQGTVEGVDNPGIMLVLEVKVGQEKQRVCVATTHIPCSDCQGGLKKVGQVMALLSAARALMEKNWSMPFILTGDFNTHLGELLVKYVLLGTANLGQIPKGKARRAVKPSDSLLSEFKVQTRALRNVLTPTSSVSKADKPKAAKPSEVKEPSEAEKLHAMIKAGRDLMNTVVAHPLHMSTVYDLTSIVDFIFHGSVTGGRRLEVVSRLELPERLALLKSGLPAVHLGSDHFALGAKFRIANGVTGVGWSGTSDYISLADDGKAVVEVDARHKKRYFL
ncbi:Protein angel 2 [Mortierella alpina]|nr:Protein angel 2 [Mortierella alpina]